MTIDRDARDRMLDELAVLAKYDAAAMDRLIRIQYPLIEYAIRRHARRAVGTSLVPDLVQLGRMGIARAVETFDPAKGHFASYCYLPVRGRIAHHARRHLEIVGCNYGAKDAEGRVLWSPWTTTVSIDSDGRFHSEEARTIAETLADDRDEDEEAQAASRAAACRALVPRLLALLNAEQVFVLCLRHANDMSLAQVAAEIALVRGGTYTGEAARLVEKHAIDRLRGVARPQRGETFDAWLARLAGLLAAREAPRPGARPGSELTKHAASRPKRDLTHAIACTCGKAPGKAGRHKKDCAKTRALDATQS